MTPGTAPAPLAPRLPKMAAQMIPKQTHKQTNTQTNNTNKQTNKHTNKHTDKQANKQTNKQTNKQANKQTYKQTNSQTNKPTNIQTNKQTTNPLCGSCTPVWNIGCFKPLLWPSPHGPGRGTDLTRYQKVLRKLVLKSSEAFLWHVTKQNLKST